MMEKEIRKVDYPQYEGKYDEAVLNRMQKECSTLDVETMRAMLYGYTFTEGYAKGDIPDELSMDYWEEKYLLADDDEDDVDFDEDADSCFIVDTPQEKLLLETIDSTGDGKTPESALCVIDVHQEYEYMRRVFPYYLLEMSAQRLRKGVDCIEFKPNDFGVEKLYFDISRRFEVGY